MNATNALSMNAIDPLPSVLEQPRPAGSSRRHRIARIDLDSRGLDRFNALLERVGGAGEPLDSDRIATAARQLLDSGQADAGPAMPRCIRQQLRRGTALAWMVGDPGWSAANDAGEVAALVVGYLRGQDDLIPDTLPRVGRLDDAIVVNAAWSRLENEVADYLDFNRVRRIEAALRGMRALEFRFGREDWLQARVAEAALAEHRRTIRESSYLPRTPALFSIQ
jgi:uncharacterized membrane protein YkvA (DUF1232 family)